MFPENNSASPLNRTFIYLCMYNENECTLLISSWNEHSVYIRFFFKKRIYISVCDGSVKQLVTTIRE